jgi:hypothetical protein
MQMKVHQTGAGGTAAQSIPYSMLQGVGWNGCVCSNPYELSVDS